VNLRPSAEENTIRRYTQMDEDKKKYSSICVYLRASVDRILEQQT
jgi:hypothetical protein